MTTYTSLPAFLTDIADAIRSKTGGSSAIAAGNMPTAIRNISGMTVGTATANRNSNVNIIFTGLNGQPKMFCIFLDSGTAEIQARNIAVLCGYNDAIYGVCATKDSEFVYCGTGYTKSYNNGSFSVTSSVATTYGTFRPTPAVYRLVYVY